MKTVVCTTLALMAFAGNSVLCRVALVGLQGEQRIDAGTFTMLRLVSGSVMLLLLWSLLHRRLYIQDKAVRASKGSVKASFFLFVYALAFSYAYISLDTGVGALILFASVQFTIIGFSALAGTRLRCVEWFGVVIAFCGLVVLLFPTIMHNTTQALNICGVVLMLVSGVAWGLYTLEGRVSVHPLADSTYNFLRTLPFVMIVLVGFAVFALPSMHLSRQGVVLALVSGGVTSGVGYALWYIALSDLSAVQAGLLQLLVPIIAAIGGIVFADEIITLHFCVASLLVLSGIVMVLTAHNEDKHTDRHNRYQIQK